MPGRDEIPRLYVEGEDDCHALIHLLAKHGVVLDENTGPVIIEPLGSDSQVLDAIPPGVKRSIERPVGFVLDIDEALNSRWASVSDRLRPLSVACPTEMPSSGFVGIAPETKTQVGVWLMPDCTAPSGKLEDLLQTLVPEGDPIVAFAHAATDEAKTLGAKFGDKDRIKAVIHCWLGWQEKPGESFGHAIRRKYFRHDSPIAMAFVAWFKRTYGIS